MAQTISNLANRSKVKLGKLHGKDIIWIVADKNHSGYPSNSVTLLTEQIVKLMCFDAKEPYNTNNNCVMYGNARYSLSNVRQWLNSDAAAGAWYTAQHAADAPPSASNAGQNPYDTQAGFLNAFSADEKKALLSTAIKATTKLASGTETCTDKVFILSCTEMGLTGSQVCGVQMPIFTNNASRIATVTADCVANSASVGAKSGAAWRYWTRDVGNGWDSGNYVVWTTGGFDEESAYASCYGGATGIRPACNVSASQLISDSTDSDGCYTLIYNQPPTTPPSLTVPAEIRGGSTATIAWGASTSPQNNLSGYVLEQCANSGLWTQIYKGSARTYEAPVTYGWSTVQYRVKAYDAVGDESAYLTSATRTVINNRAPVISGSDTNMGSFTTSPPSYEYTVTDLDGDQVTVVETLDGTTLRNYTVTLGTANTLTFTADAWLKILNGSHTLTIKATDAMGDSVTRTLTFTKAIASVEFEQAIAMPADAMPTKALVNIQGYFPAGCTLTVEICNNGNDANPTWENISAKAISGQKHYFANTAKTAAAWGVKVRVKLLRGSAAETCYIQSIGGNFA